MKELSTTLKVLGLLILIGPGLNSDDSSSIWWVIVAVVVLGIGWLLALRVWQRERLSNSKDGRESGSKPT
jgi:drug/metabolite transporter (DMT)-like permease